MEYDLDYENFETFGQWLIWQLGLDLADFGGDIPHQGSGLREELFSACLKDWHRFYQDLLTEMYFHPDQFAIPFEPFLTYSVGDEQKEPDKTLEARIRTSRLAVRKVIGNGLLDFFYQLGQVVEFLGEKQCVALPVLLKLVETKKKKTTSVLSSIEGLGWRFDFSSDPVQIVNTVYPLAPAGLSMFSKACTARNEYGYYFFRRCDFGVLGSLIKPDFSSALKLIREPVRNFVLKNDELLKELRFRREVLPAEEGGGYRVRYDLNNDLFVYWVRVRTNFNPEFVHSLRWKNVAGLTEKLFGKLDALQPGLADVVYRGMKKCTRCYARCKASAMIEWKDRIVEICLEHGWDPIGSGAQEFEQLKIVLSALAEISGEPEYVLGH
jgi:hypothetical protein